MPIFEYHCNACEADFEELVRSSDEKVKCSECGSARITKLMSIFGFKSGETFVSSSSGDGCDNCSSGTCDNCR